MSNSFSKHDEQTTRHLVALGCMDTFIWMIRTRDVKLADRALDGLNYAFESGEEIKMK